MVLEKWTSTEVPENSTVPVTAGLLPGVGMLSWGSRFHSCAHAHPPRELGLTNTPSSSWKSVSSFPLVCSSSLLTEAGVASSLCSLCHRRQSYPLHLTHVQIACEERAPPSSALSSESQTTFLALLLALSFTSLKWMPLTSALPPLPSGLCLLPSLRPGELQQGHLLISNPVTVLRKCWSQLSPTR